MIGPYPSGSASDPALRRLLDEARGLGERGRALQRSGDPDGALECHERTLALLAGLGQHPEVADVLYYTGVVRGELGQTAEAEALFHQSLESAVWCGYLRGQAYAVNGLAEISRRRGDLTLADALLRRAGRLALECEEYRLSGMVEQNLGVLANMRGDLDSALVHYRKALGSFEHAEDPQGVCWVLNNMGMLQTDLGRFDQAESTLNRALEVAQEQGDLVMEGLLELNRTEALIGMKKWKRASKACRRAMAIADERSDSLRRAEALKYQSIIDREHGLVERAVRALLEAQELAMTAEDTLLRAEILAELGETWRVNGEASKARHTWEAALEHFHELDAILDASRIQARLTELAEAA